MKKTIAISSLLVLISLLNSCASSYKTIHPETITYVSRTSQSNVQLEYKYNLLEKKYKKKEAASHTKLIAVKITNNSDQAIVLGRDYVLSYENGTELKLLDHDQLFKTLKQSPASYLWYLLLSPVQLYSGTTTTNNGYTTEIKPANSFPIGLILGPGLAGGNMIAASGANKKFKTELQNYDLINRTIKKGETVYGLIGVRTDSYDSIKLKAL